MKIVFWSPYHGQAGTTSNILAISLIAGMVNKKRVILTQTQFDMNNLEAPLVGANSKNKESLEYFRGTGIDALLRSYKASPLSLSDIENCCISFEGTNLSLLPGSSKTNKIHFDTEMENSIRGLFSHIEKFYDIIFVDVSSGVSPLSVKIIKQCDLLVINLSQNIGVVNNYLANPVEGIKGEVFYLFGNYDPNSKYNLSNLRRKNLKKIDKNGSGAVPYNTSFLDAQNDGVVIDFLRDNLRTSKSDANKYFIERITSSTNKIISLAEKNMKKEAKSQ